MVKLISKSEADRYRKLKFVRLKIDPVSIGAGATAYQFNKATYRAEEDSVIEYVDVALLHPKDALLEGTLIVHLHPLAEWTEDALKNSTPIVVHTFHKHANTTTKDTTRYTFPTPMLLEEEETLILSIKMTNIGGAAVTTGDGWAQTILKQKG